MSINYVNAYIRTNRNSLPTYWTGDLMEETISDVRDVIARGLHSDEQIAELFECQVALIRIIKKQHEATISSLHRDFVEFDASMKCISPVPSSPGIDIHDFQNMLDDIASAYFRKG